MNIKAARLLLYAFTICSALSLLVFLLWTVSNLEHTKESASAMAIQRVTPPAGQNSETSENPNAVSPHPKNASKQSPKDEPIDSAIRQEIPANTPALATAVYEPRQRARTEPSQLSKKVAPSQTDDSASSPLVLRPISETTVDGHIVASQPIDLDVSAEFTYLLDATGSAIGAPLWIEVDGNRTVLTSDQTQHVLDVLAEVKRQHQLRWQLETDPMLGLRYKPK